MHHEALEITKKFMNKLVRILVKRDELTLEGWSVDRQDVKSRPHESRLHMEIWIGALMISLCENSDPALLVFSSQPISRLMVFVNDMLNVGDRNHGYTTF
ncbi:unnamed protein product [Dovyalis caffra]|uniref:Uncharacterized protein n=1 Tax=Dovyalis caffra TaxID=77055 RepID=A0AAV1RXK0_9ROSI|nr:unnamed protein product [Dovyalis caffra]